MRILHAVAGGQGPALPPALVELVRLEVATGHEVIVAAGPAAEDVERPDGVVVLPLATLGRGQDRGARELRRLVVRIRPDVVHAHDAASALLCRVAARTVPVQVRTLGAGDTPPASKAALEAERWFGRRADLVLSADPAVAGAFQAAGIGRPERYVADAGEALARVAALAGPAGRSASAGIPPISVVVPTHHRPELLAEALASIAAQTLAPLEVVVVDDDPSEDSRQAAASAAISVRYVENAEGTGAASSRNVGLAATTGDLVAFLDDDDRWAPTFLARSGRLLVDRGAGFVACWFSVFTADQTGPGAAMGEGLAVSDVVAVNPGFTGSNALFRREVLERVGGFDPDLRVSNDKDLLVRLLAAGVEYRVVPERLALRRMGGHSRLGTASANRPGDLRRYLDKHAGLLTRRQRRYLLGRIERVQRHLARSKRDRLVSTARMLAYLGPTGVLQVLRTDAEGSVGQKR